MKAFRPPLTFAACAAAALLIPLASPAQNSIGINFAGRQWSIGGNTPQALAYTDTAGAVPQQNWNNVDPGGHNSGTTLQIVGPNAGAISDNSGTSTSLSLTYTAQGMWSMNKTSGLIGNQQLMNGYSDFESSANGSCRIDNITYSFYDVYVYISADSNGRTAGVSINGGTQYFLKTAASGYNFSNPLLQGAATDQASATNAHYIYFHNVSGSSLQIDITRYGSNIGLAGVQIIDVSGTVYKPSFSVQPASKTLYTGRTVQFTASASGTAPFTYHWRKNGADLSDSGSLSGSLSNVLTITNLALGDAGSYDVVAGNIAGDTASSAATLAVMQPTGAYEMAVLSNSPTAYYRLNETGDSLAGLAAWDYVGGANGSYGSTVQNGYYGIFGPQPADNYPGFESGNAACQPYSGYGTSQITVPSWNISGNTVTLSAWIYPVSAEAAFDGIIFNRGGVIAGLGYSGSTDASGNFTLGYTWNNDGNTYGWNSGLVPPANTWSMVALAVTPTNATLYLANANGVKAAIHTYPHVSLTFNGNIALGSDPFNGSGSRVFDGRLDEVAVFNQALSPGQVMMLFTNATGIPAIPADIAGQPDSQAPYTGQNARFTVSATGSSPLAYQWMTGTNGVYVNVINGGRVSGATTSALTISNASAADATNYVVVVSNAYGMVTSTAAGLLVSDSAYWTAASACGPVAYYGLNESGDPASGAVAAYDYVGGYNGMYGTSVKNGNASYGIPGPLPADGYLEFPANNTAAQIIPNNLNGHVSVSAWNLNTNEVTLTCWIRPAGVAPSWSGLVFTRGNGMMAGLNFNNGTDTAGNRILSYTWGDFSGWSSELAPPQNQWSFVALVITPTNGTIHLLNSSTTNSATVANANQALSFAGTTCIGCDPFDFSGRNFDGVIDEVAVYNKSLTPTQVAALYSAAVAPAPSQVWLTNHWDGTTMTLSWPGTGLLLQSTNLNGPWTTNNGATSPAQIVPTGPQMFYRIQTR
jgi:hypothetical protein